MYHFHVFLSLTITESNMDVGNVVCGDGVPNSMQEFADEGYSTDGFVCHF